MQRGETDIHISVREGERCILNESQSVLSGGENMCQNMLVMFWA